tara:strand:+ start:4244 stop:4660 length:417 start_codon:yes stop_codon:yes gene_type:complete
MPFFAAICALILAAAAAAAAAALFLRPAVEGLSEASRATGLRARCDCDSDSRREGERERRSVSKRERTGRSASSLSNRERGRRSSDMLHGFGSEVEALQLEGELQAQNWRAPRRRGSSLPRPRLMLPFVGPPTSQPVR